MAHRIAALSAQLNAHGELPSVLDIERASSGSLSHELGVALHGSEARLCVWKHTCTQVERDPVFALATTRADLSREQERELSARVAVRLIEYFRKDDALTREMRDFIVAAAYPGAHSRISNHTSLFTPAIQLLGTPAQVEAWGGAMRDFGVLGCFALSEVAHASNARGVETVAEYNPGTQEFVITSPREEAGKFWIGSAGGSATHAVVYAQLVVHGKRHGLNAFIVPLRNMKDGSAMPGVTLRDTGPKMGRNALDNGFMLFTGVRIPRTNLLARYTSVDADGAVHSSPLQALAFGALLGGRIVMVRASAWTQALALTIAVRYMLVRRQFHSAGSATASASGEAHAGHRIRLERQVLDYPVQLRRIVPLVASIFAYHAAGVELKGMHDALLLMLAKVQAGPDIPFDVVGPATAALKQLHALSAGLKAEASWTAYHAIDQARQACGGHGYSAYSGLPGLFADYAVYVTWEGDNTLMSLQLGKYILHLTPLSTSEDGNKGEFLSWLREALSAAPPAPGKINLQNQEDLLQLARRATAASLAHLRAIVAGAEGKDPDRSGHELVQASRQVSKLFAAWSFARWIDASLRDASANTRAAMGRLLRIFTYEVVEASFTIAIHHVDPALIADLRREHAAACLATRCDLLSIVEGFEFSDFMLNSCIGTRDGDVYRHYLERIKRQSGNVAGTPTYWAATFGKTLAEAPPASVAPL